MYIPRMSDLVTNEGCNFVMNTIASSLCAYLTTCFGAKAVKMRNVYFIHCISEVRVVQQALNKGVKQLEEFVNPV